MNTKKIVLWIGLGTVLILGLVLIGEATSFTSCSFRVNERMDPYGPFIPGSNGARQPELVWDKVEWCEPLTLAFIPLLLLIPLSLITYKMKDEVFQAWWRFARWWVPVIIVVTFLLGNMSGGGTLGMDRDFTVFILGILYTILIVTSLLKIIRAYSKSKGT